MKSFEQFRQEQLTEQQQLDEIPDWLNPIKWAEKTGKFIWNKGVKPVAKEIGKTAKKAWDGGENEVGAKKGSDEKGLPSSN